MLNPLKKLFIFVALLIFVTLPQAEARRSAQKMNAPSALKSELNLLLRSSVDLQVASYKRKDTAVKKAVKNLLQRIDSTSQKVYLAKDQSPHITKILDTSRSALVRSQKVSGSARQTHLQKVFRQFVLLAQMYQLDPFKIFFCPKDRSVWLQESSKPQNPVNPDTYGDCGKMVL